MRYEGRRPCRNPLDILRNNPFKVKKKCIGKNHVYFRLEIHLAFDLPSDIKGWKVPCDLTIFSMYLDLPETYSVLWIPCMNEFLSKIIKALDPDAYGE